MTVQELREAIDRFLEEHPHAASYPIGYEDPECSYFLDFENLVICSLKERGSLEHFIHGTNPPIAVIQ